MLFQSATAVALLASFVAAQSNSTAINFPISSVDAAGWCSGQITSCGLLCSGGGENDCDPKDLSYTCTCEPTAGQTNGTTPDLASYADTIPTYVCLENFRICDLAAAGNKAGKDRCAADKEKCGTKKASEYVAPAATSSATTSSTTAAPTGSGGAAASSAAAATSTSRAGAMPTMAASHLGTGVLAAGVAAAFGLMI